MPVFEFQCDCGVKFEASAPMSKAKDPKPCPDCSKLAARVMPEDLNGVFNQTVNGPGPQNTGLSSLDAHIDRVIGDSARQGWETVDKRIAAKRKVLRETGAKSETLSRNPDGSYRVRKPEEQAVHERAVSINQLALEHLKTKK